MNRPLAWMGAALLGAALVVPAPAAAANVPVTGALAGGGRYVVRTMGGAPVAAVALWYRAPAAGFDAAAPVAGLARLAAATVTASAPVTGTTLAAFVDQTGGRLSVAAYPDSIAVSAVIPAGRAAETIAAMTRSFFAPVVSDAGLTVAKRQLAAAAARRSFSPDTVLTDALYRSLFAGSAAATPTFGSPRALEALPVETVRTFAERAFRPANATLVVTGPVDPAVVRSALPGRQDAASGAEPPFSVAVAPSPEPVALTGSDPGFALAWAGPPIADERGATAFDLIADYLFYPDTGIVQRAIRKTGTTLGGTFVTYHDPGLFFVTAYGGDLEAARKAVDDGFAAIRTPLSPAAFEAARRTFVYHILSDGQTAAALADSYGWYGVEGAPAYAPDAAIDGGRYFAVAAALTPDDVARAAATYLARPAAAISMKSASRPQ